METGGTKKAVVLGSTSHSPMELAALGDMILSPAEELRRAHYAAQGMEVPVRKMMEEVDDDDDKEEMMKDLYAYQASRYRESWEVQWFGFFGFFEDTTSIPCMRFTDKRPGRGDSAITRTTLQLFSIKIAGITEGLQWPLHVYGTVFLRDSADHNRNTVFDRTRDHCQILTQEVPFLTLTGPVCAVILLDPATFEVDLKVKGITESEDKHLSFLAVPFRGHTPVNSCMLRTGYTSKLSTLEFALGIMLHSVEATITVRVTRGAWRDGLRAQFAARTTSIDHEDVILLDSRDEKVPFADDGLIPLSRRVASVEIDGKLVVGVKAFMGGEIVVAKEKRFSPRKAGRSRGTLNVGFCRMDVIVAWSLVSSHL